MKKIVKLTESKLIEIIKKTIEESEESSSIGFEDYAIQKFTEAGFKKVSNTLYKKDVSPTKTLKVESYTKGCPAEFPGFTFFQNDKPIYQGCPDACWVWWSKQKSLFN